MPNASGYLTTSDVRRMKALRTEQRLTNAAIALVIGCSESAVRKHLADLKRQTASHDRRSQWAEFRARRYDRFVSLASAYVPTFGGGR